MEKQMKAAAIYARVSSDRQKEEKTIASQTAALTEFACKEGYDVPREWIFEDEGFSGASLVRPGLECLRDLAAEGQLEAILVYSPDRLSRKYAYQILLTEEFARNGVETVFVKAPKSDTPEDQLLLQFQGMIAEYERAQILERSSAETQPPLRASCQCNNKPLRCSALARVCKGSRSVRIGGLHELVIGIERVRGDRSILDPN